MVSPDNTSLTWVLVVVASVVLALLLVNTLFAGSRPYRRFASFRSSWKRRRLMRKWLNQSAIFFGSLSVVSLAVGWQHISLLVRDARELPGLNTPWAWLVVGALTLIALLAPLRFARVTKKGRLQVPRVMELSVLLPRNRQELRLTAALGANAAVVEELLFRLALPTLVYAVTRNALLALAISTLLYAGLHAYRGLTGILSTLLTGALFAALFVLTGTVLVPILVHGIFEFRTMVAVPVIVGRVHRSKARW